MAGNVKEWCWNASERGRFLLGGAWNEHPYTFDEPEARSPFDRAPVDGFRLAKYIGPVPAEVTAPVQDLTFGRDARTLTPVSDEIFAVLRRQYAYDRGPLNAVVEATEETDTWLKHVVAFDTAYGGDRMRAFLFLPKNGSPPYETVIFFPAADAFLLRSSRDMQVYERLRATVLTRTANATTGKPVFGRHCGACHTVDGTGGQVGPDLSGIRNQPADAILLHGGCARSGVRPRHRESIVASNQKRHWRLLDGLADPGVASTGLRKRRPRRVADVAQHEGICPARRNPSIL